MICNRCILAMVWLIAATFVSADEPAPDLPPNRTNLTHAAGAFQLLDGDRVIFVGDTLIERAQNSDDLETFLTARNPDRQVFFRNLGWSGDTVYGEARAGFGTAADGFEQLRQQVQTLKPTVIFVGYGANSSFDGPAGLERFKKGYHALLDMLEATKAEIILLTPIRHEDLGSPLPDPRVHNESLRSYAQAIGRIAADRGHRFVDLFSDLPKSDGTADRIPRRLTENGIHLSSYGYWQMARAIETALGMNHEPWGLTVDPTGKRYAVTGDAIDTRLEDMTVDSGRLRFSVTDRRLPQRPAPQSAESMDLAAPQSRMLTVIGLAPGNYTLQIDGEKVQSASAGDWSRGVALRGGPEFSQVEELRQAIMLKNRLYFYRWRPQNETYLFGFRKHEQGQNAKEVPMFDPLISAQEEKIAALRIPLKHIYELKRDR